MSQEERVTKLPAPPAVIRDMAIARLATSLTVLVDQIILERYPAAALRSAPPPQPESEAR